jgi:RHS repeat-associated protein
MLGSGRTVIQSGASGVVDPADGSWVQVEEERTLVNEGELAMGVKGGIVLGKHGSLLNKGTLLVNGETGSEDHGIVSNGGEPSVVNTGTVEKTEGSGTSTVAVGFDNEGSVSAVSGKLEFTGGGTSGVKKSGSWSASGKGTEVIFGAGSFALGATVGLSGAITVTAATVSTGKVEGAEASLTITTGGHTEGVVEVNGSSPSTLENLTVTGVGLEYLSGGVLTGSGEVDVTGSFAAGHIGTLAGSGSTVIEPEAKGTILTVNEAWMNLKQRTLNVKGSLTVPAEAGIVGENNGQIINSGTITDNGEKPGSDHGIIAPGTLATLTNTGTLQKTEGSGLAVESFVTDNEGNVKVTSGQVEFRNGGVSGVKSAGSWSASGIGTEIIFGPGTFELGVTASLAGSFYVSEGTVIVGTIEGSTASLTVTKVTLGIAKGIVEVNGVTPSKLQNLTVVGVTNEYVGGGILTGTGEVDVSGSFTGGQEGYMEGTGSTVIEAGAKGNIETVGGAPMNLIKRTLVNKGTLTVPKETGITGQEHALILNTGTMIVNGEPEGAGHGLIAGKEEAKLINTGTLKKNEGTGTTPIEFEFENLGAIVEETGRYKIFYPVARKSETTWGPSNPSAPGQEPPSCGDPVDCATGNYYETQSDLAVGGRGVGLDLTRTYNAQAAANGLAGAFGHGWSSSFSDSLVVESSTAMLHQANGSTVPFVVSGTSYIPPAWSQDSLSGSAKIGYSLVLANQIKYQFEGSTGRLQSVTDRNGNQTKLAYNKAGQLETITDPAGRKITLTYNGEGLVESAKDPLGHTAKYTYSEGNLASVTLPGEAKARWQYHYDGSHQMTLMIDGRKGETTNEYNSAHQLTTQTDPAGHKLKFEYEPFHTKITNNTTSAVTDEHFTSNDEPFSIVHGFGTASATTTTYTYDAANDLTSTTDGNNHTTTYTYENGNRLSMVDPNKNETKWTYDGTHDVLTVTAPDAEKTTITRNSHGDAETVSRPAPHSTTQTTTYHYDEHGDLTSVVDPLKHTWSYEYDAEGDCTSSTDPEGDKRTYGYNEDSQRTSIVSPAGNVKGAEASAYTTKLELDQQGRPTTITDPLGHTTKYAYDGDGNIETTTDGNGHTTTYTYDADNEPTKVKEPNGTVTETGYDGAERVTSQTDGNKHTTTYVRNILGEVTEIKDPLGRVTKKEYDTAGNLTAVTDAAKRTTKYSYDPANRLKEISYSENKTPTVKYEYNGDGERTKTIDGTGTTTYTYDILDRLVKTTNGHGNIAAYEYDVDSNQIKLTYPNNNLITRAYDSAGRLQSVTDWAGNTTTFAYNPNSDLTTTTFPKGTGEQDKIAYNNADQQTKITMTGSGLKILASVAYTRDGDGQIKTTTTTGLPGTASTSDIYDANNRLEKSGSTTYAYDAADEPTTLGANTSVYDAAGELKTSGSNTYGYDQVGDRVTATSKEGQTTTYGYNQAGNLIQVKQGKGTTGLNNTYAYNGEGLRVAQTKGKTTSYVTWDTQVELPSILSDEQNNYIYGPDNIPIEAIQSKGLILYLHHDQQGSTRMLTSTTGAIEATTTYDAYGNTTGTTGNATTPLGYDGQYTDADTGLIYLRARAYDPATAQFLSVDPLRAVSGEPYSYAGDNPLNASDPTGLIFGISGTPSWEEIGEGIAGWGDTITFGATNWVREELGINNINACSDAYQAGGYAGLATAALIPGEGEAEVGAEGISISAKIARQMETRGWTEESIQEAINSGEQIRAINKATGNPATRYISPTTGKSVVVDDVTTEVIHVGGQGMEYGPGSGDLP